ncbi:MAG: insulinase family protein, partial [Spirochaetaceae bacterium]|nr:insulinase family protein [Spirochaetaceae bacterium]
TAATYIQFPFSTTDERQFKQLADYYLSAVYEPTLDDFIFMREGFRYELPTKDSPLTINGIVYNEMKGANSNILRQANSIMRESLFPDTAVKNDSAGKTETIPTLTVEDVRKYHKTYFVPSNSIIGIYGDLDIDQFLAFLDGEWLSKYEKSIPLVKIPEQKSFSKPKSVYRNFPVAASYKADGKAVISKGFALTGISEKEMPALMLLINILNNDNSPLMKALDESNLADHYFISVSMATRQPQFEITAQNITPEKASTFEHIVLKALKEIAAEGVDPDLFASVKADFYAGAVLARENTGIGLDILESMAVGEMAIGSKYAIATANYDVQNVTMQHISKMVDRFLVNNNHSVLVIVDPKPGLAEEKEKAERDRLAKLKASMSPSQINALVTQTSAFNSWLNSEDKKGQESVKKLQVLTPESLDTDIEPPKIKEETWDNVRHIHSYVKGPALRTTFYLNLSDLTPEELHYASLYMTLTGELGAGSMTEEQVDYQLSMLVLGLNTTIEPFYTSYDRKNSYPVMNLSWYSELKNARKAEQLVSTILYDTILDPSRLKVLISMEKARADRNLQSNAVYYALSRAGAACAQSYALYDHLSGIPYYQFIQKIYKDVSQNPSVVIEKMLAVRDKMLVANSPVIITAGINSEEAANAGKVITKKLREYSGKSSTNYTAISQPAKKTAFIIKDSVSYVASAQPIPVEKLQMFTLASDILSNEYYIPKIRLEGGAYGASSITDRVFFSAYSSRDPNPMRTLEFQKRAKTVDFKLKKETLAPYIIARHGLETAPTGIYTQAFVNAVNYIRNYSIDDLKANLEKTKNASVIDVESAIRNINAGECYVVMTNEQTYSTADVQFDEVVDLTNGN